MALRYGDGDRTILGLIDGLFFIRPHCVSLTLCAGVPRPTFMAPPP
jgi:hypothetical protein